MRSTARKRMDVIVSVASPKSRSLRSYRWYIFTILAVGYFLVYFHRLAPAVVAVDMMRDLSASGALMGLLGAAYFYPYALMQLPSGLLADSWGARHTITVFMLIAAAGSLLFALAPSALLAICGRTLVGLGVAMLFVSTLKVLTEWFSPHEFATMTGILFAIGGVGSLASAAPLAWASSWFGWRLVFVAIAVATLVLAALVWLVVRDRPAQLGFTEAPGSALRSEQSTPLLQGVKMVLTCRHFWPLASWFFFLCAIFFSFGGLWGGPYLQHVYALERSSSGNVLSMLSLGMIVGSPLLTWLSNRVFKARKPVIVASSGISLVLILPLVIWTAELPLWALAAICFGFGMFTSAVVVIGFAAAKELFPLSIAGTSIGLINLFPFAGGAVMQPTLGAVLEGGGRVAGAFTSDAYRNAFLVLTLCAVLALLSSLWIKEPRKD